MKTTAVVLSIALLLTVRAAQGQDTPRRWHTVRGVVVNEKRKPAATVTVCLRDVSGHRLRMKQTDRGGRFSFGLVKIDENYEIYAERTGLISKKLVIPTVQSRHDVVVKLVLSNKVG